MPRKPASFSMQCDYFCWRLILRDGVYYADGRMPELNLGKHTLGTRDREEAIRQLRMLDQKQALKLGRVAETNNSKPVSDSISVVDAWAKYLSFASRAPVMGGVSPATAKRYRAVRDHHLAFCLQRKIAIWTDFGPENLEQFGDARSRSQAYRTVHFELTVIKTVSKWLAEQRLIPADSRLVYPLSKPTGTDAYCYRPEEVATMIDRCSKTDGLNWLADVIVVLAHTGLRISEAASLRWSDIDFTANTLRIADERFSSRRTKIGAAVRRTKGRRSRAIPIHPRLRALLGTIPRGKDGLVLHAARGGKLLPRNVLTQFIAEVIEPLKDQFPTPADEVGFEHGRLHSFRHYFCSQAFVCGASEGEVREWLGHADSRMVEHYRHLRTEDALRRMERITFVPPDPGCRAGETGLRAMSETEVADSGPQEERVQDDS